MTPEQLQEIARLAHQSVEAADAHLDELLKTHPERADHPNFDVWVPTDIEIELATGNDELTDKDMRSLAQMLSVAGVGPRLHVSRLAGEDFTRSEAVDLDVSWTELAEHDSTADPDVQALGRLRLLAFFPFLRLWRLLHIRQLVQFHLSELLVAFPAHPHPRMGFSVAIHSTAPFGMENKPPSLTTTCAPRRNPL